MAANLADGTSAAVAAYFSVPASNGSNATLSVPEKGPQQPARLNPNFRLSTALATVAASHQRDWSTGHQNHHHHQQQQQQHSIATSAQKGESMMSSVAAAKFEANGQLTPFNPAAMLAPSSSTSSAASLAANPYWSMGAEWGLAAMAMSRTAQAGLCADASGQLALGTPPAYYGQMAAAAALSAASSSATAIGNGASSVWYPHYDYYGLQRAGTAASALNGYGAAYATGPYATSVDYYGTSFPAASHYAAAALSSNSMDLKKGGADAAYFPGSGLAYCNGQYGTNGGANVDLQAGASGSELDTSPMARPNGQQTPSGTTTISAALFPAAGGKAPKEKSKGERGGTSTSKRSKKKKAAANGQARGNSAEPNNTALVFVWELEDICCVLPPGHHQRSFLDRLMSTMLGHLLQCGFQLENQEEFDQANVEDAVLDEQLQNAICAGTQNAEAAANTSSGELQQQEQSPGCSSSAPTAPPSQRQTALNEGLRRLAAKYRHVAETYARCGGPNAGEWLAQCGVPVEMLCKLEEYMTLPFAQSDLFRKCLRTVSERSSLIPNRCTNVVLSSNVEMGVAAALGRLMLCRMSEFVPAENVYCTARMGKEAALERLANQFQKKHIMMITSNAEMMRLAKSESLPCWPLYTEQPSSLMNIRPALEILLGDIGHPLGSVQPQQQHHHHQHQQFGALTEEKMAQQQAQQQGTGGGGFLTARG